jgi:hypothetical protein
MRLPGHFALPRGIQCLKVCLTSAVLFGELVWAQQAGHYLGGITGLENGTVPPPGGYATYLPYIDRVDSLKGPSSRTLVSLDLNVVAHMAVFAQTVQKKVLGGNYGWSFIAPAVNTRFTANEFNASAQAAGLSDIYFSPLVLGWEKGKADFTANYGFYAPTGAFDASSSLNAGLGFWEQQIQAGATYSLDKKKLWNTSLLTTWEINGSKLGLDLKPGPMFTGEYSFGRRFFKYQMNAGAAGYAYQKLAADSGSAVKPITAGILDRQFGAGPEWKYTNLKWHMGFDFRFEQQFGVEAKTSGQVFVISITYLRLNLPPPQK